MKRMISLLALLLMSGGVGSAAAQEAEKTEWNIAILIFDGVQIIDYTAPYEVFGQMSGYLKHNVYSVAPSTDVVTTEQDMRVLPSYSLADHPRPDVLVVPGGNVEGHLDDPAVLGWIKKNAGEAEHVLSVCNGAFFLAKAGLLDGLEATTFYALLDSLETFAPQTTVVRDRRFVDNGKIVTTAGLSSGIDGSLHVVSKMHSLGWAQAIALNLEYDWDPNTSFARAMMADQHLPGSVYGVLLPGGDLLKGEGDRDHWEEVWTLPADTAPLEILRRFEEPLAGDAWERLGEEGSEAAAESRWRFTGRDGGAWQGRLRIAPDAERASAYLISIFLDREGA